MTMLAIDYWKRREREERSAADRAATAVVRDVHSALAERYADRVWSIEERGGQVARM